MSVRVFWRGDHTEGYYVTKKGNKFWPFTTRHFLTNEELDFMDKVVKAGNIVRNMEEGVDIPGRNVNG